MTTFASICSGGGGWEVGAVAAGLAPAWGIEYDPRIAEVHAANVPGARMHVARVQDVALRDLERVDVLAQSQPCTNFSNAKTNATESAVDLEIAEATARIIRALTPRVFLLENVPAFRNSKSFAVILAALHRAGYQVRFGLALSADYGIPQTRRRLILRAVQGGAVPHMPPTHSRAGDMFALPWNGWLAAIADLVPSLPESQFAPWQIARLPAELSTLLFHPNNMRANGDMGIVRQGESPAFTLTQFAHGTPRAFIVAGQRGGRLHGANGQTVRTESEPAFTSTASLKNKSQIRAFIVSGGQGDYRDGNPCVTSRDGQEPVFGIVGSHTKRAARAWLAEGRVVSMTPRALARFQSFPDSYVLPEGGRGDAGLACKVVGNAVCPDWARQIIESVRLVLE